MNDLTYMQRIALHGEIGRLVGTYNKHEEDIPFMCFLAFALYDLSMFNTVKEILCEFVEKDIVLRVSYYVQSCIIPYDIWSAKIIADIKWLIGLDISSEDEDVLRSIFCNYFTRLQDVSLYACHYLLGEVLKDKELGVLHEDAFYLRNNIKQPVKVKHSNTEDSAEFYREESKIFSISFMKTEPLVFDDITEDFMSKRDSEVDVEAKKEETNVYANLRSQFSNVSDKTYFLVEKKEVTSNKCVSSRKFVNIEEVISYLLKVSETDSTLTESYQFIVVEIEDV